MSRSSGKSDETGGDGGGSQSRSFMLNKIWTELQSNLPSIDLDDDDQGRNDELADFELDQDLDSDDDHLNQLRIGSGVSVSQVRISDQAPLHLISRLESMGASGHGGHHKSSKSNTLNDSVRSANKITKNIFDTTNSSLSMDVLNSINIDEVLENLPRLDQQGVRSDQLGNRSSESRAINDEIIMKKLSEMSQQYKNETKRAETSAPARFNMTSALQMIERELGPNYDDDEQNKELQDFLRSHNIRDGNLVKTRRLDLRSEQQRPIMKQRIYSKPDVESFFESMVLKDDAKQWSQAMKNNKIKFLNDQSGESSSDTESDGDTGRDALWIERYRKQKLTGPQKK